MEEQSSTIYGTTIRIYRKSLTAMPILMRLFQKQSTLAPMPRWILTTHMERISKYPPLSVWHRKYWPPCSTTTPSLSTTQFQPTQHIYPPQPICHVIHDTNDAGKRFPILQPLCSSLDSDPTPVPQPSFLHKPSLLHTLQHLCTHLDVCLLHLALTKPAYT